jgi:ubiquinone/menaquinone biosynthesis C-methylase UbiE
MAIDNPRKATEIERGDDSDPRASFEKTLMQSPQPGKTVLHVGCGPYNPKKLHSTFRTPEWRELRLDINPAMKPDVVGNITDMPEISSESVDAVWSSHNIEHLYHHEVPIALREFWRVLKPGGFALIATPDLNAVIHQLLTTGLEDVLYHAPAGAIAAIDIIYGHRASIAGGNLFMQHKTAFTESTLADKLRFAGFRRVAAKADPENFELRATAYK